MVRSRSTLARILKRVSFEPVSYGSDSSTDIMPFSWYTEAVSEYLNILEPPDTVILPRSDEA